MESTRTTAAFKALAVAGFVSFLSCSQSVNASRPEPLPSEICPISLTSLDRFDRRIHRIDDVATAYVLYLMDERLKILLACHLSGLDSSPRTTARPSRRRFTPPLSCMDTDTLPDGHSDASQSHQTSPWSS